MKEFLKNGTVVKIVNSDMKATVIGVCIRGVEICTVEYNVQWVSADNINNAWVYDFQVEEFIDVRQPAGLVNYETSLSTT